MNHLINRIQFLGGFLSLVVALVSGCASYQGSSPVTKKPVEMTDISPVVSSEKISVTDGLLTGTPLPDYLVGPGDVLSVSIYGYPNHLAEGSSETAAVPSKGKGSRVDSSGSIQVPRIGSVQVAGLTLQQVRDKLQDSYKVFLKKPSVVVEIIEYKSHPLYLLGQFKKAGAYYMDRPLNLLQGLALGEGLSVNANLRAARLLRGNKIAPVDIYSLLHDGEQQQNVWLLPGDTIYVPDNTMQHVVVMGAVKKPGQIPMNNGKLSLHEAIAAAEGVLDTGHERNIRIIRSISPTRGELIVVDLERLNTVAARPFPLSDGDIVYVPKNWVGNWNQAINELLPTLQLIGAVINPFVQIKFLSQ